MRVLVANANNQPGDDRAMRRSRVPRRVAGLAARLVLLIGVATTPQEAIANPARAEALVLEGVRRAAEEGADAIVMGGAALAGFAARLQPDAPVPLLDGIVCAVRMAEMLAALALAKPRTGSCAAPTGRAGNGLSPALAALLRGRAPR